jgi:lipid II:glycine glycyltransferase (peptidoglycan interpeptide bridge formation enzyme)
VDVGFFDSFDSIKQFYGLHCLTRKRHGVPPQPFYFFEKVFNRLISQGKGSVFLALYGAETIAAMVFFHFGTQAIFKYGASDARHHSLKPNNILMWRAIQWYAANNFTTLDFGRTDLSNMGLLRLKRAWGTTERILNYYRYDIRKQGFVKQRLKPESLTRILRLFPSSVLRVMGHIFYKYVS